MTRTLTTPISIATIVAALFVVMLFATATSARAEGRDGREPLVIVDCYDPEVGGFVPCEDIEPDQPDSSVPTPGECPEGTVAVPDGNGGFRCDEPDQECDEPYSTNYDPCIPPPDLSCERIEYALNNGANIPADMLNWFYANCVDDDYNCRELAYAINNGLLVSEDAWNWYHANCVDDGYSCEEITGWLANGGLVEVSTMEWYEENCRRPEITCRDIFAKLDNGERITREEYGYWLENCTGERLTCEDVASFLEALGHEAPAWVVEWYEENCRRPELTCEDIAKMIENQVPMLAETAQWYEENCTRDELTCEDLLRLPEHNLTEEQKQYIERNCQRPECEVDCDEPQCPEGVDCEPVTEETPTPETPQTEETPIPQTPQAPKPPKAGTGSALFTTVSSGGLGLASIALIAAGGAVAGLMLRRKA